MCDPYLSSIPHFGNQIDSYHDIVKSHLTSTKSHSYEIRSNLYLQPISLIGCNFRRCLLIPF